MLMIQEVLVSDAVVEEQFLCNLSACKGACCVEGDSGAPLEKEELEILGEAIRKGQSPKYLWLTQNRIQTAYCKLPTEPVSMASVVFCK